MLVLALSALGTAATAAEPRRIGLSLPLSGAIAQLGKQFAAGAALALERSGAKGVELVTVDDNCERNAAEVAAADLKAANVAIVTGVLCNEAAFALAKALRERAIPVLIAGAQSGRILRDRQKEGWRVWRLGPADGDAVLAAAAAMSKRWSAKPWAVLDDGTANARLHAELFRDRMEEAGPPPQLADAFRPGQENQAALVRRLQSAGVQAVYVAGDAQDVAALSASAADAKFALEVAGGPGLAELPYLPTARKAADGLIAVLPADPAAGAGEVLAVLKERGIAPDPYVLLGYGATQIALASLAGTPESTAAALSGGTFATVLGPVRFNADGSANRRAFELRVWKAGAFEPLPAN
jgi:branched-chain amino acid transport system substrate-binding protein